MLPVELTLLKNSLRENFSVGGKIDALVKIKGLEQRRTSRFWLCLLHHVQ